MFSLPSLFSPDLSEYPIAKLRSMINGAYRNVMPFPEINHPESRLPLPIFLTQVAESSLFNPKDLVDAPASGRCSPAVLKCLAALSEAVRSNAATDPPGTSYDGPLLGDAGRGAANASREEEEEEPAAAVVVVRRGSKEFSSTLGVGSDRIDHRPPAAGDAEEFVEETPTSPESALSGIGSSVLRST